MNNFIFNSPVMFLLLPLVAVFAILYVVRSKKTALDIEIFAGKKECERARNGLFDRLKFYLLLSAVLLVVIALTRPGWNPHFKRLQREGRDVVFILDVSNSMLADDIYPSRLERAKMAIAECVDSFDGSNRVALVVFAGSASIKCPLTLDTDFFHYMLDKVTPLSVDQGGTRLSDAIIKTCDKLFADSKKGYKDIILLSDGGDQGGEFPKAAKLLNDKHVKLIAIGIGNSKSGSKIPLPGKTVKFMQSDGRDVITRLEGGKLRQLVQLCNSGAYLPVGTKNMHLDRIYKQLNTMKRKELLSDKSVTVYDEKYQLFLFIAVLLLIIMVLMPIRNRTKSAVFAVLISLSSVSSLYADSAKLADAAFTAGDYDSAVVEYLKAVKENPDPLLTFQLGNAYYKKGDFADAVEVYKRAMQPNISKDLLVKILYNIGNSYCKLADASQDPEEKVDLLGSAILSYRKVLFQVGNMQDAGFNIEFALLEREKILEEIKKQEDEQEAMKQMLQDIKGKLMGLIEAQSENLINSNENIKSGDTATVNQKIITEAEKVIKHGTDEVTEEAKEFHKRFFEGLPEDLSLVGETLEQLQIALDSEVKAVTELEKSVSKTAAADENKALEALKKALQALPADQQKQQTQNEDQQNSDESEESDSESQDESDSDSSQSSSQSKVDMENNQLPPPNESPDDILKQDEDIQKMREKNASGKKRKPVKMDW